MKLYKKDFFKNLNVSDICFFQLFPEFWVLFQCHHNFFQISVIMQASVLQKHQNKCEREWKKEGKRCHMVKLQSIILANARIIFCEEQIQLFTQMIQYIYALTCSIEPFSILYIFFFLNIIYLTLIMVKNCGVWILFKAHPNLIENFN